MKKIVMLIATAIFTVAALTSCSFTNPSYDEEVALKMKPWFVWYYWCRPTPVNDLTCIAWTTSAVSFYILPQKVEFKFDDLLSKRQYTLWMGMYMVLQVQKVHTPELLQNYGEDWAIKHSLNHFKNKVR